MSGLPEGTVTFLFSDIEGSTSLLRQLGQEALRRGAGRLSAAPARGVPSRRTAGKSTRRATRSSSHSRGRRTPSRRPPARSVRSPLPRGPTARNCGRASAFIRVRPRLQIPATSGLSVHRGARVCAAGAGGQVVLSQATAAVLEDDALGELRLRSLGRHALKDFDRPVELYQLDVPGLPSKFARPKTQRRARPARRLLLAGTVAAPLVLGLGLAAALVARGEGSKTISPTSVGVVDPDSNRVVDEIDLGTKASLIAAGEGFVWLADRDTSTLIKIDPRTREIVRRSAIGATDSPTEYRRRGGGCLARRAARPCRGRAGGSGRSSATFAARSSSGDARGAHFNAEFQPVFLAVGEGAVWTSRCRKARSRGSIPGPVRSRCSRTESTRGRSRSGGERFGSAAPTA